MAEQGISLVSVWPRVQIGSEAAGMGIVLVVKREHVGVVREVGAKTMGYNC